jgi:hypothetical protein
MVGLLAPLFRVIGHIRKLVLTPLARYWLKPCCENPDHHTNYTSSTYLPLLGANVFKLRESIRDSLFTRRTSNFRVICTNRMLGLGPMLDDERAAEISEQWGRDAVHPLQAAYATIASALDKNISDEGAKYINPPKSASGPPLKCPKIDQSRLRQDWVVGCSAALPRRDTVSGQHIPRGNSNRGKNRGGFARPKTLSWSPAGSSGRGRGGGRWWRGK